MTASSLENQPLATINITPLIDVMLVLLVMLIITIPPARHKIAADLPQPRDAPAPPVAPHRLAIDAAGRASWDGVAMDDAAIAAQVAAVLRAEDDPALVIAADPAARYERFNTLLGIVRRGGIHRLAFAGNGPQPF